jgi:multiple antibiotic resistance protein
LFQPNITSQLTELIAAALTGETLLHTIGTSLASFRDGGGIVLLLIALAMLRARSARVRTTPAEEAAEENRNAVAAVCPWPYPCLVEIMANGLKQLYPALPG